MPSPIGCMLLIDDDSDDNFLHQLMITESGLCDQIRVMETGPDALHYLTHPDHPDYLRPDIILLDIQMPLMNGFEFLEAYRHLPAGLKSRVVVVMLTTSLGTADQQREQLAEVSLYATKPLTKAGLQGIVDQHFS